MARTVILLCVGLVLCVPGHPVRDPEKGASVSALFNKASGVYGQKSPAPITYYTLGDRIVSLDGRVDRVIGKTSSAEILQTSGDFLLGTQAFSADSVTVYDRSGKVAAIPLPDLFPVFTMDWFEELLYVGGSDRDRLLLRVIDKAGKLLAQQEYSFETLEKANTNGKLFSLFDGGQWVVWNPKSREVFQFDSSLSLLRRVKVPVPPEVAGFDPKVADELYKARGEKRVMDLENLCKAHHMKALSVNISSFFVSEERYGFAFRVFFLSGQVNQESTETTSVGSIAFLDKKQLSLEEVVHIPKNDVLGLFHTSRQVLISRASPESTRQKSVRLFEVSAF